MHSFNPSIATKYGVDEAVMINNLYYWIKHNEANNKHFYDGNYWTYNSIEAFTKLFPYWTNRQVERIIKSLISKELVKVGNFNKSQYDRTRWFTLTKTVHSIYANGEMEAHQCVNENTQTREPIPYSKPYSKPSSSPLLSEVKKEENLDDLVRNALEAKKLQLNQEQIGKLINWFKQRVKDHPKADLKSNDKAVKSQVGKLFNFLENGASFDEVLDHVCLGDKNGLVFQNIRYELEIKRARNYSFGRQNYPTPKPSKSTNTFQDSTEPIGDENGVVKW